MGEVGVYVWWRLEGGWRGQCVVKSRAKTRLNCSFMATRRVAPNTLSTPPKAAGESRKASGDLSLAERVHSMSVLGEETGEEDVEMHSAAGSDGWETQDSMWDEEREFIHFCS